MGLDGAARMSAPASTTRSQRDGAPHRPCRSLVALALALALLLVPHSATAANSTVTCFLEHSSVLPPTSSACFGTANEPRCAIVVRC
mgnify:CR=1 FL=1